MQQLYLPHSGAILLESYNEKPMINSIGINEFMSMSAPPLLLDVRTPAEFTHGHIPGAANLPLFSNEERVAVGTTYKQTGREPAILLGFDLVGGKWSGFIREALRLSPTREVAVHCWRGGMRSGAMAWALDLYGFKVSLISGGYKSYRRWVHDEFRKGWQLKLLGGMTGSGKTKVLQALSARGEQTLNLEALANHQGSAYGTMDKLVQPGQEQFENDVVQVLSKFDINRNIWVEDEGINIGRCQVPKPFWQRMQLSPMIDLKVAVDDRVGNLVLEYGGLSKDFLIACTERIRKRLGPEQTKNALLAINENRMEDFIREVLRYYDKSYLKTMHKKDPQLILPLEISGESHPDIADGVLKEIVKIPTLQL
jgi:tRNA 2-selenouridine synthase